jgi:U32 family peptidase
MCDEFFPVDTEKRMTKPELLAPAGNLEKCRTAFLYGADAVYLGGRDFNLRNFAGNLDSEELAEACTLAHRLRKKIYVTVNAFATESDLTKLPAFLHYLQDLRADGIVVSDPAVLLLARQWAPEVPLHLSTQANTTSSLAVRFWQEQGIRRVNLAREITFEELSDIRRSAEIELEVFIHGAMCISYSGRCLLSAFLNRRSANRGCCTQPCRWSYNLVEEKRPGEYFAIEEDTRGSYIFNSKDLCLLEHLGKLMALGVHAFKIEGRMKGALYLASVIRTYRQAIDRYWEAPDRFTVEPRWQEDLAWVSHRPYTAGLLFGDSDDPGQSVETSVSYVQSHTLAGIVRPAPESRWETPLLPPHGNKEETVIEVRSRLAPGMEVHFLGTDGSTTVHVLGDFQDLSGNRMTVAHPNTWIRVHLPFDTFPGQAIRIRR